MHTDSTNIVINCLLTALNCWTPSFDSKILPRSELNARWNKAWECDDLSVRSVNISPQAILSAGGSLVLPGSAVQTQIAPAASFWTRNNLRGRGLKPVAVIRWVSLNSAERWRMRKRLQKVREIILSTRVLGNRPGACSVLINSIIAFSFSLVHLLFLRDESKRYINASTISTSSGFLYSKSIVALWHAWCCLALATLCCKYQLPFNHTRPC